MVPSPIPAKSEKEVNEILKYFKKKNTNPQQKKLYTNATLLLKQQELSLSKNIVKETVKIKNVVATTYHNNK